MDPRSRLIRRVIITVLSLFAALISTVGATLAVARPAITHSTSVLAPATPIPLGIPNVCAIPLVLTGAITSASPMQTNRLVRDGVVGACGQTGSCAITDTSSYPYQKFDFTNASADAQCVSASIDASACTGHLYSTAYLGNYFPGSICSNYLAAMGLSTSSVLTYSFLVPANAAFSIVNSAAFTVTRCESYTLTVRPCSANVAANASLSLTGAPAVTANANGTAVITYALSYKNTGNYTAVVPSASVLMTPLAQSIGPNLVFLDYGRAGGLIAPGKTVTENVAVIATSSARSLCLPTTYTLTTQIGASASVYECNWGNPALQTLTDQTLAEQTYTGTLQPGPWLAEDRYAFSARAGWNVTITVNTIYSATTFDPKACISAAPNGACLPGLTADDSFICDFQPNFITSTYPYCPIIMGTLPATPDGIYYLRVTSFSALRFAGSIGQYRATIELGTPDTALCPTVQVLEDGSRSFLALAPAQDQPQAVEASSTRFSAISPPVVVTVPPLAASCALLPLIRR